MRAELDRRRLGEPVPAQAGRLRGDAGAGHRYAFQIAGGMYDIRPEDRVRIRAGGREAWGVVLRFERGPGSLQVAVMEWLGERVEGAELEFDPTWLLRELSARLVEMAEDPDAHFPQSVLGLFGRRPPRLGDAEPRLETSLDLNAPQRRALERVLGSEAQLVWGPPGTGKSRLVARAALELAREGRVLVTATTNGAVDEIVRRLAPLLEPADVATDRVVRVGSDLGAPGDLGFGLEAALERRIEGGAGGVRRTIEDLEARLRIPPARAATGTPAARVRAARALARARASRDTEAARAVGRVLLEIGRQAERVLEEADVVLTTFARLSVREELRSLRYESLIIDEASTAPLPYVALAASYARARTVAVGDFQQLPPVVSSRGPAADRWLRCDIFREAGVVNAREGEVELPSVRDGLCAMLDVQYRMSPGIRDLVSEFFYDGRLRDAPGPDGPAARDASVLLLDTSRLSPSVERVDGSRRNRAHAELVARLLEDLGRRAEGDIAVVSPYRAQTRVLRDIARRRLGGAAPAGLEISTIHRFQGREKRVVVIDTVDAPPGRSWFLDERRNPDLPRLVNVALSRAREELIIVASVDGLRRTLPPGALLNRLLARIVERGERVPADPAGGWPDARGVGGAAGGSQTGDLPSR